jgi:hypothetical protein
MAKKDKKKLPKKATGMGMYEQIIKIGESL